jgi:purine-nucleoside phosphorylase
VRLERGVYIGVHGPEMESPAETRMYRQWGADAVGMSTVLEVIAARHLGLRALGLSCLSNKNLPDCMTPVPLAEVIAVAARAGENLARLLRALVTKL